MSTISIARRFGQGIVIDTSDGPFLIELEAGVGGTVMEPLVASRLKVTGPDDIPVHRREVFEQLHPRSFALRPAWSRTAERSTGY
jgi:hypothetical protein